MKSDVFHFRFDEEPGLLRLKRLFWHQVGGTFTVNELRRIVQEYGNEGGGLSKDDFNTVMEAIDLNEDGRIDYKQLVQKMKHL